MNRRMLIRNNRISGLSLNDRMKRASCSGACERLTTVLNAIAAPTSKRTTAEVVAAFDRTEGMSVNFSVRRTNRPMMSA